MAQLANFRLKVFRAVAEHMSFRKAAEHLFLTQRAVTLQIKALASDLGVRLFDRAGGQISLKSKGRFCPPTPTMLPSQSLLRRATGVSLSAISKQRNRDKTRDTCIL